MMVGFDSRDLAIIMFYHSKLRASRFMAVDIDDFNRHYGQRCTKDATWASYNFNENRHMD